VKRTTKAARRIAELEAAIFDLNQWCLAIEGVTLTYFIQDPSGDETFRVVNKIIGIAAKRPTNGKT
jgi:hypothetical protein